MTPVFFTFHYVSIKTSKDCIYIVFASALHSTMSLLKLLIKIFRRGSIITLHSTMSLLKLETREKRWILSSFTFHYVSIKTLKNERTSAIVYTLHSTMSLLKHCVLCAVC